MLGIGDIWTVAILRPMLNALLLLYSVLGHQFWLAIVFFTIIVRLLMTPLMLPQQRSAKKMQELQPQLAELKKKYGKDQQTYVREQQKLFREAGVNPLGGCLPLLIQFPIWIGLYQSIIQALGHQPLDLLALSQNMYHNLSGLWAAVPLNRFFLGMDLSLTPQQIGLPTYILPILVAFTSWWQSKMMTPATPDPQSASMNQSMTLMMPLMFGFFSLNFSTGLSFYFIISNVIGIVSQGFISGWSGLKFWKGMRLPAILGGSPAPRPAQSSNAKDSEAAPSGSQKGITSGRKKKRRRKR